MRWTPLVLALAACVGEDPPVNAAFDWESHQPVDGAVDVPLNATVTVVFSEVVRGASLTESAATISPSVAGQWSSDSASRSVRFVPSAALSPLTTYTVNLSGLISEDGSVQEAPLSFSFKTASTSSLSPDSVSWNGVATSVTVDEPDAVARTFRFMTQAPQRDGTPQARVIVEDLDHPRLRTGHRVLDGLFALAIDDARQASVSEISDGAFGGGQPTPCDCFETGEKWTYVWTRDTAFAVDLGLSWLDPQRSRNSLLYKLSDRKASLGGGSPEIVQDTGTGGSWPVSSDRVVWALGASRVLDLLEGAERQALADRAWEALHNTLETDRLVVHDPRDGLYRGETSFLDWREQTYGDWTASDTAPIASSKSLSTNVAHHQALSLGARLASERGEGTLAARYQGWADDLAEDIIEKLVLDGPTSFLGTRLDEAPAARRDLLAESLVVIAGLADASAAKGLVSSYPRGVMGSPVIWPQQPDVPIYHNRAIWPFVSGYSLRAAKAVANASVFDREFESILRGAAWNLSNMENFEWTTQANWRDDGALSGPVVNSRRQLWSVGAFLGMVTEDLFGIEATSQGLRFDPFVTERSRSQWLGQSAEPTLEGLRFRGREIEVRLELPSPSEVGEAWVLGSLSVDGQAVEGDTLPWADLKDGAKVVLALQAAEGVELGLTEADPGADAVAPRSPRITAVETSSGQVKLSVDRRGEGSTTLGIYRDGVLVDEDVSEGTWVDPDSADLGVMTMCYAVDQVRTTGASRSQHSPPVCDWGEDRLEVVDAWRLVHDGGVWSTDHGRDHIGGAAGNPVQELVVPSYRPRHTGRHLLQLDYGNGFGGYNTGITAGVRRITVLDSDGDEVGQGFVAAPQRASWDNWGDSTFVDVSLSADEAYDIVIDNWTNMSGFDHFSTYVNAGGGSEAENHLNVAALKVLALDGGGPGLVVDPWVLDSTDVEALPSDQRYDPAAPYGTDRFALDASERALVMTLETEAFTSGFRPWVVYLQAGQANLGAPVPGEGFEYSGLTPDLPFTPTHALTLRATTDAGDGFGPWAGLWRNDGGSWSLVQRFKPGRELFVGSAGGTVRVDRDLLGDPAKLRFVAHVVDASVGSEWKDLVPVGHTPWDGGGDYVEIDLSGDLDVSSWVIAP